MAVLLVIISLLFVAKPIMRKAYTLKYEDIIITCSNEYNLDKYLVMGIISTESKFDENAVSHKGAKGLMQLKDETASWCIKQFNISTDCSADELNIRVGCSYIRYLIDKYNGNIETALAAYNAGEGNVAQWLEKQENKDGYILSSIPYKETEKYVKTVKKRMKIYKFLY